MQLIGNKYYKYYSSFDFEISYKSSQSLWEMYGYFLFKGEVSDLNKSNYKLDK